MARKISCYKTGVRERERERERESSDPVILIGGDSSELGLGEDKCLEVLGEWYILGLRVDVDGVKTRLIFMHRVEYYLHILTTPLTYSRLFMSMTISASMTNVSQLRYNSWLCRVGHGLASSADWTGSDSRYLISSSDGDPKSDWSNVINCNCISALLCACLDVDSRL